MMSDNFERLYAYRERKGKGNLENFFTELVVFMCDVSPRFKEIFVNKFLKLKVNSGGLIVKSQESFSSFSEEKERDIPDLKLPTKNFVLLSFVKIRLMTKIILRKII